ncbi:3-oxoacyl-ACP reductase [Priestia endophytica]|jgi:3-oxoacyl-[acyl-carrier protein] reductase|uniref:glucose 1-dehydrogenase [NAD(P)(+)] n=1 Tax=Priestia endophytica TaxID=135735 RepID=A0AAX1Q8D4_9BACI|nr:3-oxoacyl-ACP reductase [Priestia endophytica]RAS76078.1 3-oxoacyl-ACP reductase [Priestia endophytica]RAS85276.1 3-oxoacyl-ACP reductase [Priestia endophytica]
MNLKQKIVLITGASRGIGAEIARQFGAAGSIVVVNYLNNKNLAGEVVSEIEAMGGQSVAIRADVTDSNEVNEMIESIVDSFGAIDVVVNNALSHYTFNPKTRKTAWEMEWEDYNQQWEGSVHGAYNICKAVMPHMKNQMSGRMINMVSNLIHFPIVPYHDYTTAKMSLLGYTRNLAKELGGFGITVNAVAPGLTYPTDSSHETKEDIRNKIIQLTPLHRLAQPKDIAGSVLFLASDLASFITGQCLNVDGGLVMH